jgi:hypothetical protein
MYAHEYFFIHTDKIIVYQNNQCLKQVLYYNNIVLLKTTNSTLSIR